MMTRTGILTGCLNPRLVLRGTAPSLKAWSGTKAGGGTDYYKLFPKALDKGPPPEGPFLIDLRALRNEFLRLQARTHPDMARSEEDKENFSRQSALINRAYSTLSSPLLRARYLLARQGIDLTNEETTSDVDPEMLGEILEIMEEIEDANTEEDLESIRKANNSRIARSCGVLEEAFANNDLEKAAEEARLLRYWTNIESSLQEWEPGKPVSIMH